MILMDIFFWNIKIFYLLIFIINFCIQYSSTNSQLAQNLLNDNKIRLNKFLSILRGKITDKTFGCNACIGYLWLLETLLKLDINDNKIEKIAFEICYLLRIEDKNVCSGSIYNFKDEVFRVLRDTPLAKSVICTLILQEKCSKQSPHWNITFPNVPKPPTKQLNLPKDGSPILRVLHLTDVHIDFKYVVGSDVDCAEPLCCRLKLPNNRSGAGFWGSLGKCDLPRRTVEQLFSQLSKQKFDYILWTGDLPSHSSWDQNREEQIYLIKYLGKLFQQYFPNIKVYPALGNHESVPVNGFTPPFIIGNLSSNWLYEAIYKSWSAWLPESTKATITRCGFYTTKIASGYRIISLNMNYCHYANFWLLINETDPCSQLQWLISVLQTSEDNKELVQIIGHIPPGSNDCVEQWSWNYYSIINRYENIIVGQYFGHVHNDAFQMFFDNLRPVSVAYLAPSLTTYSYMNPGYRIYYMDGFYTNTTWYVLDHETYILNLTNSNSSFVWTKEYSAKEDYGIDCLWPSCWYQLWQHFGNNITLFNKYYKYFYKSNMVTPAEACDTKCRHKMICDMYDGRSYDEINCPYKQNNVAMEKYVLIANF